MRLLDHEPIDPEIAASLDAIDAVLAGEPVEAPSTRSWRRSRCC